MTSLTQRMRMIRQRTGLTQKKFSRSLGLGENTWQRWELKGLLPTGDILACFAADGVSIDWLITGEGPPDRAQRAEPKARSKSKSSMLGALKPQLMREVATKLGALADGVEGERDKLLIIASLLLSESAHLLAGGEE